MVERRMRSAGTGILFGLSICVSLWKQPQCGERRGAWPWQRTHHLGHFAQTKSTWLKVHSSKAPLDNKEAEAFRNYSWLDWISTIHRVLSPSSSEPWLLIAAESTEWCSAGSQSGRSSKPTTTLQCKHTVRGVRERMQYTHVCFAKHDSHWQHTLVEDEISTGAKSPSSFGVAEERRLIVWRLARLDAGRSKKRKSLLRS